REVVLELAPRLGQAFPHVPTVALYGGVPERWAMAPLMVMTTHQSLRFRRLFDLLIVDEVDAFPYHHDPMLPRAVAGALADGEIGKWCWNWLPDWDKPSPTCRRWRCTAECQNVGPWRR